MKLKSTLLASFLFSTSSFAINCKDFGGEFATHNGHYYAITGNKMTFETAKQFATSNGGYLAIPNTTAENDFIKGIVGANNEAFLGIYDPSYSQNFCLTGDCFSTNRTRFKTVAGATLTYQNWDSNDVENKLLNGDDSVDLYGNRIIQTLGEPYTLISGTSGLWRDWGTHFISGDNPVTMQAVIEFDTAPTCYEAPSGVTDTITGRVCNSQVWNETIGVSNGTTAQCLNDVNNVEYCPQSLAECGQSWDYAESTVTSGVGVVVDYTNKVTSTTSVEMVGTKVYKTGVTWRNGAYNSYLGRYSNTQYSNSYCTDYGAGNVAIPMGACYAVWGESIYDTSYSCPSGSWYDVDIYRTGVTWRNGAYNSYLGRYSNTQYSNGYCTDYGAGNAVIPMGACYAVWGESIYTHRGTYQCLTNVQVCPSTYTDNGSNCKKNINYTYYNYLCLDGYTATNTGGNTGKTDPNTTTDNTATLDDPLNSSTPPANNCKKEKYTCQADETRPCALVDSKMQCSPFPCLGESNFENAGSVMGANDKNNDGWSNDGSCAGQIYIYGGKDSRCRSSDKVFGLTGGGCCDKDKVAAGLVNCKDNEKMLAKKNQSEFCHYVGEYCSKKIKLGFTKVCVQDSKSYCCFNSTLARIIHEQGRPQIGLSWGAADAPDCRGFKPEEFQKLDMSKMDFSSAFKDIKVNAENITTVTTNLQNKMNNIQVPK